MFSPEAVDSNLSGLLVILYLGYLSLVTFKGSFDAFGVCGCRPMVRAMCGGTIGKQLLQKHPLLATAVVRSL